MDPQEPDQGHRPAAPASLEKALRLLAGLRDHPAGGVLYAQVERLMGDATDDFRQREDAYAAVIGSLIDALAECIPASDPLYPQVRMLRHTLQPPLLHSELQALEHYVEQWAGRLSQLAEQEPEHLRAALEPLLGRLGLGEAAVSIEAETPKQEPAQPAVEERVNLAYRQRLDQQTREIQRLEGQLAEQIEETIRQHQEFGVALEVAHSELRRQREAQDVERTSDYVLSEIEKFLEEQQSITSRLGDTYQTLQSVSESSRSLSDELDRVRQLSLTDELTSLPNRRAFQRRLEDEAARVNRYGYPLTVAMIDLDEFKSINDTYGHAVGDRVLVAYATKILSTFRHHDLVARYGGEEFAVLLPNTGLQGVLRALEKVRLHVPNVTVPTDHQEIKAPTFSAGVAVYRPGETADNFVSRADGALYHAKRLGRNRTEVATEDRPRGESVNAN